MTLSTHPRLTMPSDERWIPADPEPRAGLYKRIEQVPDHQRLEVYEHAFEGRDCWAEYIAVTGLVQKGVSERRQLYLERTEQRWKSFMQERGTHHALCTPADAEAYATCLIEEFSLTRSTAAEYWADIERFYRWMFHDAEYPHRYHPFVMAAANYETSSDLWYEAIEANVST